MNCALLLVALAALLGLTQVQAQSYQIVYRCTDSAGLDVDANLCTGLPKPGCGEDVTGASSSTGPASGGLETPTGPGGVIVGDPQFVGLRGQDYQIHGVDGAVYNLISDKWSSVNSRFVFLSQGKCPVVNGEVQKVGCFSHPGSYLGAVGVQTSAGDRVLIESGDYRTGLNVTVNGAPLKVGQSALAYAVQHSHTHVVTVRLEQFTLTFTNSDMFVNQAITLNDPSRLDSMNAHGMVGSTHQDKVYPGKFKFIPGTPDDYMIPRETVDPLFSLDYKFNMFA